MGFGVQASGSFPRSLDPCGGGVWSNRLRRHPGRGDGRGTAREGRHLYLRYALHPPRAASRNGPHGCDGFQHIIILPNLSGVTNSAVVARDFSDTLALEVKQNLLNPWAKRLKRTLDLFGAIVGGLVISPLLLTIAVLIKLNSPGPVLFGHRRLGARDEHFLCWKFRTMHEDAEKVLNDCLQRNPSLQAEWEQNHKLRDDPRVTRIGRFLRKTSLDELPQLWNVLRGEMSLAGPRPIVDAEVPKYEKDYELYRRTRPGMSGLWQVGGRSEVDYGERVAMDSYYVRNWSVWLDIIILVRTTKIVVFSRGAY